MPVIDARALIESRIQAIENYHQETRIRRAQLDLSGGVDSAVMLGLLTQALGPEQVTVVYSGIHSSEDSLARARQAAQAFGVRLIELELSDAFDSLVQSMLEHAAQAGHPQSQILADIQKDPAILGSFRSCLRAPIGRALNRMTRGGIRHGTGNECEDRFIRFYQKGGDGEVDTNPIEMLSKGEVYQVAKELGVPDSILLALPAPDLHANAAAHNDETELFELTGIHWTYSRVDPSNGQYTCIGTIEAMSRFLDRPGVTSRLFGQGELAKETLDDLVALALRWEFRALAQHDELMRSYLLSARKLQAISAHKHNPAIPSLGSRAELLIQGCLVDTLPDLPLSRG